MDASQAWIELIEAGRAYRGGSCSYRPESLARFSRDHFSRILLRHIAASDSVLEAGCGFAFSSFALAYNGRTMTALDISEALIDHLRDLRSRLAPGIQDKLTLRVGDIFDLGRSPEKFNAVFHHGVVEHWLKPEERRRIFQNIRAALVPGGKYIVAVPNLMNPLFRLALDPEGVPSMHAFTLQTLESELESAGFRIVERGHLFVSPGFEQWLKRKWLAYPAYAVARAYRHLPGLLQRLLSAHIYCVAQKGRDPESISPPA